MGSVPLTHRLPALVALAAFFGLGAAMAGLSALALLLPDTPVWAIWRLNPEAHASFLAMGSWGIILLVVVSAACAASAYGLWRGADWGRRLAVGVLTVNLAGDAGNLFLRSDPRTLIGLPIGGIMILYLMSGRVRERFQPPGRQDGLATGSDVQDELVDPVAEQGRMPAEKECDCPMQ